jgi:hypothetical protein
LPQQAILWFDRKGESIKHASVYTLALLAGYRNLLILPYRSLPLLEDSFLCCMGPGSVAGAQKDTFHQVKMDMGYSRL